MWPMMAFGMKKNENNNVAIIYINSSTTRSEKMKLRPKDQIHSLAIETDALNMDQKC